MELTKQVRSNAAGAKGGAAERERMKKDLDKIRCAPGVDMIAPFCRYLVRTGIHEQPCSR